MSPFHTLAKPFLRNILKTFRGSSNKLRFNPARRGIYRRPKAIQSRGRRTQQIENCQKAKEWLKKSGKMSKLTIGGCKNHDFEIWVNGSFLGFEFAVEMAIIRMI